ncbi:uncharacterized protein N0V89_008158 [Didymosphaeria variabile]|uniref:Transmembrane protein n=1 Tax=Didymosphaeria variabile TaxID=1932322 RepID=A0A9W8XG87_9PLEO|nr:uncharacterized protein N0V89_008158 [Didymosphaeria variabile]KAJ4349542.1 hypothetical protein N0V89_008158 [Didymosphaeria variabile]
MARASAAYWLLSLLVLAQKVVAQDPTATQNTDTAAHTPNAGYNGGDDNPLDPSDAGAAGAQNGGFSLSKGGLAAIIVVISVVVVVGGETIVASVLWTQVLTSHAVASAVLFWLAKKRQWDVRQSLRRASRRITGRSTADLSAAKRQNRRTGVRLDSPPAGRRNRPGPEKDLEKGLSENPQHGTTTTKITSTFDLDTPTPKAGWKMKMPGGKK